MTTIQDKIKEVTKNYSAKYRAYELAKAEAEAARNSLEFYNRLGNCLHLFGDGSTLYAHLGYDKDGRMILGAYSKHDAEFLSVYVCPVTEETTKLKPSRLDEETTKGLIDRMRADYDKGKFRIKDSRY
jgi:hypothetical protein